MTTATKKTKKRLEVRVYASPGVHCSRSTVPRLRLSYHVKRS